MDASSLIEPLINALGKQGNKTKDRVERLQYWKTLFEVATLAGGTVGTEMQKLCREELADAEDEARKLNNKFVGFITNIYTVIVMDFCITAIAGLTDSLLKLMHQQYQLQPQTVTLQQFDNFIERCALGSLVLQVLASAVIWFWGRWKIRDFVWNGLKPGKTFHFLLNASERVIDVTKATLTFALPVAMWVNIVLVFSFPQNLVSFMNQR